MNPNIYQIDHNTYHARRDHSLSDKTEPKVANIKTGVLETAPAVQRTVLRASHIAVWANRSPAHMVCDLRGETESKVTEAMDMGRLRHALYLRHDGWESEFVIIDYPTMLSKAAKTQAEDARDRGLTPVLRHKYDEQIQLVDTLCKARPEVYKLITGDTAKREHGLIWERGGVWFKALHDSLVVQETDGEPRLVSYDLKTVAGARDGSGIRRYAAYNMHDTATRLRLGHYLASMKALRPEEPVSLYWLVCENTAPHHSILYRLDSDAGMGCDCLAEWTETVFEIAEWNDIEGTLDEGKIDGSFKWPPTYSSSEKL